MAANSNFFVYTNAQGVDVVVARLADVPPGYRAQARAIDLSQPAVKAPREESAVSSLPTPARAAPTGWHQPSFAAGAGAGLLAGVAIVLAFNRSTRFVSWILGAVLSVGLAVGYLSWVRARAGLPPVGATTPAVLLDDARQAAEAMKRRNAEVERVLDSTGKH